jgi:hypothetical protein
MLLILEIGMLIAGIIALITGKLTLTKKKVVLGTPARVVGLIWFIPLPVALLISLMLRPAKTQEEQNRLVTTILVIEIALILSCFILGLVIGLLNAKNPKKPKKRRRVDEDIDEDDEEPVPARRPRRRDDDDEPAPVQPIEQAPARATQVVECPGCGKSYSLAVALAGKKIRCKKCQEVFDVPHPE